MIEPFLEEGAWCYWVVSGGALLSFIGLVVACICSCRRNENKNEFLGLPGMVTLNDSDNDGFGRIQTSDALRVSTQDAADSGKRSIGANRSLPDIPKDREKRDGNTSVSTSQDIYELTEPIGDQSELYATVRDTGILAGNKQVRESELPQVLNQDSSTQEGRDEQYSRFPLSPTSENVEHPYAQLQSVQKLADVNQSKRTSVKQPIDAEKPSALTSTSSSPSTSTSTSTSTTASSSSSSSSSPSPSAPTSTSTTTTTTTTTTLTSMSTLATTTTVTLTSTSTSTSMSACEINGNPIAPPRTRRSLSHNSLLSAETISSDIQAANAITGGVQANQDLPYMTPPLLMLLPQPPQAQSNSPQQHFSGDSQDSKGYTSISVREPLANIIAQTKTSCRQNQSIRTLTDPHYATVSDDSDEMYAAIDEQEKVYTSGSETYAQIQPTMTEVQRVQNEQTLFSRAPSRVDETYSAPQPPSVDSLRHVAHAHSRQASSSSANSSIINPGSPKPEKRQANSPLPPPPEGTVEVYASIEKRTRNEDRMKASLSSGKSLEDMYAKVMKKKKDVEDQQSDTHSNSHGSVRLETFAVSSVRKPSLVDDSRISWSSHDSMETQKKEPDSVAIACGCGGNSDNRTASTVAADAGAGAGGGAGAGAGAGGRTSDVQALMISLSSPVPKVGDDADVRTFSSNRCYQPNDSELSAMIRESCDPNYEVLRPQQRVPNSISDYQAAGGSVLTSLRGNTDLPSASAFSPMSTSTSTPTSASTFTSTSTTTSTSSYTAPPPLKHRQTSNASSEDPGYEKVRLKKRSEIDQDTDSEPNYESMPHDSGEPNYASVCRPGDSDTDPNYESVNHGDPNYESVKYMCVSRAEEPPYEQVNAYKSEQDPVGYEKVKKQTSFNADYERILHQDYSTQPINGDTDDEQYVQV